MVRRVEPSGEMPKKSKEVYAAEWKGHKVRHIKAEGAPFSKKAAVVWKRWGIVGLFKLLFGRSEKITFTAKPKAEALSYKDLATRFRVQGTITAGSYGSILLDVECARVARQQSGEDVSQLEGLLDERIGMLSSRDLYEVMKEAEGDLRIRIREVLVERENVARAALADNMTPLLEAKRAMEEAQNPPAVVKRVPSGDLQQDILEELEEEPLDSVEQEEGNLNAIRVSLQEARKELEGLQQERETALSQARMLDDEIVSLYKVIAVEEAEERELSALESRLAQLSQKSKLTEKLELARLKASQQNRISDLERVRGDIARHKQRIEDRKLEIETEVEQKFNQLLVAATRKRADLEERYDVQSERLSRAVAELDKVREAEQTYQNELDSRAGDLQAYVEAIAYRCNLEGDWRGEITARLTELGYPEFELPDLPR